MIATAIPIWMLAVMLAACCGLMAMFGLLVQKRPVIAGLGIATVVLVMAAGVFWVVNPARFGEVRRNVFRAHIPFVPKPPSPAEIKEKVTSHGSKIIGESLGEAKRAYRKAMEEARALGQVEVLLDPESVPVAFADSAVPSVSVEVLKLEELEILIQIRDGQQPPGVRGVQHRGVLWSLLAAVEIAVFLCVGYVILDGSTRGQFTWPLRIASVLAFAAVCVAMASLRHHL